MKRININDYILVKLTEYGEWIYNHRYDELNKQLRRCSGHTLYPPPLKKEPNGFVKFQMWDFMQIFGEHFKMGSTDTVIEGNNVYFYDIDLVEVKNAAE